MRALWQDIRYGFRMLVRNPGFTVVVVLVLALGIGATTAIFSVVNAVLLRPLPYKDADQLVMIWESNPQLQIQVGFDEIPASPADFIDWRDQNHVFEKMAALKAEVFDLVGTDEPEQIRGAAVSADLFPLLGVEAVLGRTFLPEEEQPTNSRVVLISHGLWQRRFGSDPGLVGRTLNLNKESYTVVGIMPPGFYFPRSSDMPAAYMFPPQINLWTPLAMSIEEAKDRNSRNFPVVGKLKKGVSLQSAQEEMNIIARRIAEEFPESYFHNSDYGVNLVPLHQQIVKDVRPALLILWGAVGFVLLIVCTNVANLVLTRATARNKEITVRAALGAGRVRLIRQLLTESVLLAVAGGVVGLLFALWGIDLMPRMVPGDLPRLNEITVDGQVLSFTLVLSLLTGVIFGLAPAFQASKVDLNESLKEGGRSLAGTPQHRLLNLLVLSQVAVALVLLIGAGLLIKSFVHLLDVNPGFNPKNVLTIEILLSGARYPESNQKVAFYREVLERIEALPGVQAAGSCRSLPFSGMFESVPVEIEGGPVRSTEDEPPAVPLSFVSQHYFRAVGIPLLKGRIFTQHEHDSRDGPPVVIVNETLARAFWPNEEAIGKRLKVWYRGNISHEVVGVVADVKQSSLSADSRPFIYVPYVQAPGNFMFLVVRTAFDPMKIVRAVRNEITAVDKDQPISNIRTMKQLLSDSVARPRFVTLLLGIFASAALTLAVVGIYGVMAYSVSQRTHEIGIRMALGAQVSDVLKLVLGQGMKLALIGVAIGVVVALALTRVISSLLYGVSPTDPLTFVCVSLFLAGVALFASYIPARRATKVDPMVTLRYE